MNSPRLRTAYSPLFAWEDCTFVNQFVTRSGVGHPDDFFLEGACAGRVPPAKASPQHIELAAISQRGGPQHVRLYVPSLEEATHPRCDCEGYPDWPGRASSKEGES